MTHDQTILIKDGTENYFIQFISGVFAGSLK